MKNLIFDYDGTLHETMRIYGPAFRKNYENLVSRGLAPAREFSDAEISGWLGFTAADMWNRFAPQLSDEEKADSATILKSRGWVRTTSTALLPIDPVAPRMTIRFTIG